MKSRLAALAWLGLSLGVPSAWAQWTSNPARNLPIATRLNNDQVQPKVKPLPNGQWYVSWFDANPNSPPPLGYDVFLQRLDASGKKLIPHYGALVADLGNSSTEDYGLDIDTTGHALLAFLDTREGANQQVTAAKLDAHGQPLWGNYGVQLTADGKGHYSPKITGTSDGGAVVAWTSNTNVEIQKLDQNGHVVWPAPIVLHESGYNYNLADLHAVDNGSVILSWERDSGFTSNHQLRANKISATGKLLWGKTHVVLFDQGSLQFGEFPYFILDGSGGAVFAWYTASPNLQCFAQHIRANGKEAFPHNGAPGSTDLNNVRVDPSVSYRAATDETFLFWTEEDSLQFVNGVYGQKFNGAGTPKWGATGLVLVPLGPDQQSFVRNIQLGSGALVLWVDAPGFGAGTIQATKLNGTGDVVCGQFPVASAPSNKYGLSVAKTSAGMTALAWTDDRIGNNAIYMQNVNSDCTLGKIQ